MDTERDRVTGNAVLDSLREPLCVVDSSGTIVYTNGRLPTVTAASQETVEGQPLTQLSPSIRRGFEALREHVHAVIDGEADERRVELEVDHPDSVSVSPHRYTEARVTPLTDRDGFIGALVIFRDITDRKQTEQRLRQSERQFRTMFESHSAPMLLIAPGSGEIIDANVAASEFYGYAIETLTSMAIQEINCLSAEDVARERERAQRENRNHFEFEHELASGEVRPVEVHSSPIDIGGKTVLFSIIHDITEREQSKRELQLFKEAVVQTANAVLITDVNGTIEYVNPAFEATTGYTSEEAIGRTPRILKSDKQDDAFYDDLWETILAGEVWQNELINQRQSGELYYAEQTIAPITDDDEITNFVAIQWDITDRKLRQKRLADLNRILRHNLRNALTAIEGHTQVLLDEVQPEHRPQLEKVLSQAKSLAETSEKITTVRQSLESTYTRDATCDIGAVLSHLQSELTETYPDATIQIDSHSVAVELAASTCRTLLTELVNNAVRHNDRETPRVTVTVEIPEESAQHITIHIADNGPGIPSQEQTAVEVGTDDSLIHSSGVGLAHVHWLVVSHGGDITISENDPCGSVVTLSLPRADGEEASGAGL